MEQLVPSCCVSCLRHPPKLLEDAYFLWIFWLYQKKGRNPRSLAQVLQENDHISHFFKEAEIIFGHINVKEESRRGKLWCSTQVHCPSPRKRQELRAFNLEITPHLRLCNLIVYGKSTSYCRNRWWMDHLTSSLLCKCLVGRVAACAWLFSYGLGCCLHRLLPNLCSELDAQLLRSPCSRASSIQSHNPWLSYA
jgi:hypothetical protein